jgi:RsbT co-antagonist protein rsbRD N-terminal domain
VTLKELMIQRQSALCGRWLDALLADYGAETAAKWRREKDPFANPVGHTFRIGAPQLIEAISSDGELGAAAAAALEPIIRIRSIQDLAPSRAVSFVYMLRDVIRVELASELAQGAHDAELSVIERRIERLALLAFDVYVRCRDQVFRLRQEELKRSVAMLLRRWHGNDDELAEPASEVVRLSAPPKQAVRR